MTDTYAGPMVKFFCTRCGKEMWELIDWNDPYRGWDDIRGYTLAALLIRLVCSDCLLAEIRADRETGAEHL